MAAWLEQQDTKQVIESEIFLGRHKDNDLCLPHEGVSRRHALVAPSLGGCSRLVLRVDPHLKVHAPDVTWSGLMKRFFREPVDPYTAPPPRLHQWLRATTAALVRAPHASAEPFVAEQSGSKLVIRCLPSPPQEWFLLCTVETPIFESSVLQSLGLSDREADVMKWIAEGKTNADIGGILTIATSTVNKHVKSILKKLGVENRSQAIREVIERVGRG